MKDLPKPAPASPFQHLEERKAAIYENLRDLQFEFRLDKLTDSDYQASKLQLQKELAQVMAETDRIKAELGRNRTKAPAPVPVKAAVSAPKKRNVCAACGATARRAAEVLRANAPVSLWVVGACVMRYGRVLDIPNRLLARDSARGAEASDRRRSGIREFPHFGARCFRT